MLGYFAVSRSAWVSLEYINTSLCLYNYPLAVYCIPYSADVCAPDQFADNAR